MLFRFILYVVVGTILSHNQMIFKRQSYFFFKNTSLETDDLSPKERPRSNTLSHSAVSLSLLLSPSPSP
jgi:hypothetical protein